MGKKIDIEVLAEKEELTDEDKAGLVGGKKEVFNPGLAIGKETPQDDLRSSKQDGLGILGSSHPSDI